MVDLVESSLHQKLESARASLDNHPLDQRKAGLLTARIERLNIRLAQLRGDRSELELKAAELNRRIEMVQQEPEHHRKVGFFQHLLLEGIFPASEYYTPERLEALDPASIGKDQFAMAQDHIKRDVVFDHEHQKYVRFGSEEKRNRAARVKLYTDDQFQLDGCIVYGDPRERDLKGKKMMVMVQGNCGSWQTAFTHAQAMARKYGCNVLIYNPRGVGASQGRAERLRDAVTDCRAAISFAVQACGDPKRVALYGHSLGGGVGAEALQEMVQGGTLPEGGVGLYINHHSFSSLSDVVKAHTKILGGLARKVIGATGHTNLRAKRAIQTTRLADRIAIATGRKDKIISGVAQVGVRLQKSSQGSPNEITYISTPYGHHEEIEYLEEHRLPSAAASSSSPSSSPKEEGKEAALELYHQAIHTWVTH